MKTKPTFPGLKELLLPQRTSRAAESGSAPLLRALFRPMKAAQGPVELVDFLREVMLFEALDRRELRRLARIVHEREYSHGEFICEEGNPAEALFVVRRGTVEVVRRGGDGREVSLAVLEPPASLEEAATVGAEAVRWFSVRARGPVSLIALDKADLAAMMLNFPVMANKVLLKLAGVMAMRLQLVLEAQILPDSDQGPEAER